jgi:heterodisulfide reductase subunit B
VTRFDDPSAPTIFESLVEVTGATPVTWARRLECCGNPIWSRNEQASARVMQVKLDDARKAGADYIATACTYCQMQFDTNQAEARTGEPMAAVLYPQLLGLAMGLPEKDLGLERNRISLSGLKEHLPH